MTESEQNAVILAAAMTLLLQHPPHSVTFDHESRVAFSGLLLKVKSERDTFTVSLHLEDGAPYQPTAGPA